MAVTTTTRFALTRWSAGTDPFSRAQMDSSHAQIEALGAIYGQGALAARPAAGVAGRFYTVRADSASNNGRTFYDDGTAWFEVGSNGNDRAIRASAAGAVPLTVHGFAGQTANLQEWRNSAGTVVASVGPSGAMTFTGAVQQQGGSTMTTLAVSGSATLQAGLTVTGSSTFGGPVTVNGDLKASKFRSTATRASGLPKTEMNDDGTGRMDALIPPGHFMLSLRATVADGWLAMNGQTVSTTTYRDLWEALGSPGGVGATTFVVPDWRDRTAMGASATKAIGSTGGADSVTLSVNNVPGHVHSIAHDHTMAHTHGFEHTHQDVHTHTIAHDHTMAHSHTIAHDHTVAPHAHAIDHTHTMDHSHTIAHTHTVPPHTHTIDHGHSASSAGAGWHNHGGNTGDGLTTFIRVVAAAGPIGYSNHATGHSSSSYNDVSGIDFPGSAHYHGINGDGNHAHSITVNNHGGGSGASATLTSSGSSAGSSGGASTATTSGPSSGSAANATQTTSGSSQASSGAASNGTTSAPSNASSGGSSAPTTSGASVTTTGAASNATTSAPSAANSGSTGSGTAFSVLPPYGAGTWVIKT